VPLIEQSSQKRSKPVQRYGGSDSEQCANVRSGLTVALPAQASTAHGSAVPAPSVAVVRNNATLSRPRVISRVTGPRLARVIGHDLFRSYVVVQTLETLERYERYVAPATAHVGTDSIAVRNLAIGAVQGCGRRDRQHVGAANPAVRTRIVDGEPLPFDDPMSLYEDSPTREWRWLRAIWAGARGPQLLAAILRRGRRR
jgi:hypothetical protein